MCLHDRCARLRASEKTQCFARPPSRLPKLGNHSPGGLIFWQTLSVWSAVNILVGVERRFGGTGSRSRGQGSNG